jgi:hypothetical protein
MIADFDEEDYNELHEEESEGSFSDAGRRDLLGPERIDGTVSFYP